MNKNIASLVAAAFVASGSAHADMLYTVLDNTNTFASINPNTLAVTAIGATGATGDFGDLAYDSVSRTMYWVAGRGNNNLYTINMNTGAATLVGSHGVNDMFSLGWSGTGLYAQATNGAVYQLNTSNGSATMIGSNNIYPGGFDFNTVTGQMISISAGAGDIKSINLSNGSATQLGNSGHVNDADIAFDAGRNRYWVSDYSHNLFAYDATTFARTTVMNGTLPGPSAALEYVGAVPEPETYALLLAGLGLMGTVARRRRAARG